MKPYCQELKTKSQKIGNEYRIEFHATGRAAPDCLRDYMTDPSDRFVDGAHVYEGRQHPDCSSYTVEYRIVGKGWQILLGANDDIGSYPLMEIYAPAPQEALPKVARWLGRNWANVGLLQCGELYLCVGGASLIENTPPEALYRAKEGE